MLSLLYVVCFSLFATLFWEHSFFLPIKYLCVFLHESCHGILSLVAGGMIKVIQVDANEGGETVVKNLHFKPFIFFIISAGYLGSAFLGALILRRGLQESYSRTTAMILACCLGYMTQLFTLESNLAYKVGMGWSVVIFLASLIGKGASKYLLLSLGTVFIWYSFFDLFDFTGGAQSTDAAILSQYIKSEQWFFLSQLEEKNLISYISFFWSILVVCIVALVLLPVFRNRKNLNSIELEKKHD